MTFRVALQRAFSDPTSLWSNFSSTAWLSRTPSRIEACAYESTTARQSEPISP